MAMRRVSVRRLLATVVTAIVVIVGLAGCATNSPDEQADRQRKAADVQVFELRMAKELWNRTSAGAGHKPIENPQDLVEDPNGSVTVRLTGSQLVDYLQLLDFNAHGGFMAKDKELASTVYDALAPVLDGLSTPIPPDAPAPTVTIDAAIPLTSPSSTSPVPTATMPDSAEPGAPESAPTVPSPAVPEPAVPNPAVPN